MESKPENLLNNKAKSFRGNTVLIEGGWFYVMNLTDGEIFPLALIKR